MNAKKIIFWPPLLVGIGTGFTIGILAYITYESILSGTEYGLWFMVSFGSTVINVFGFPKNRNSQPKNVLFGHLLSALVGIIFINFFEALKSNQIAGAGLDVYDHEPLPDNHKLRFLPNALLLPHLGYVTAENYSIFYTQMFEDLEACVKGEPIRVIES